MFEIESYKKRFDANKVIVKETGKYPYIVRMGGNNGQKGFIDEDEMFLNEGNTISFGQDTATMFYQEKPYFTGDKIKILKSKYKQFNKNNAQFFIVALRKPFSSFSWGRSSFNIEIIKSQKVLLPTQNGEIDFDFMESFIAELEARHIAELEAYLSITGLKDYNLTAEEEKLLANYESIQFKEYSIVDIFDVNNTHNILSCDITKNSGKIPYLCASAENNAVSAYISYDEEYIEQGNCIFIGGKTFVISYQKDDFYSNDSHNLVLYLKNQERTKLKQLYLCSCIYKSLSHKYSWGNSISKAKIKLDKVALPTIDGKPCFDVMETFISAVQKLVIKDVILYSENKINATKDCVSN